MINERVNFQHTETQNPDAIKLWESKQPKPTPVQGIDWLLGNVNECDIYRDNGYLYGYLKDSNNSSIATLRYKVGNGYPEYNKTLLSVSTKVALGHFSCFDYEDIDITPLGYLVILSGISWMYPIGDRLFDASLLHRLGMTRDSICYRKYRGVVSHLTDEHTIYVPAFGL